MNISTNEENNNNKNEIISSLKTELINAENRIKSLEVLQKEHFNLIYKNLIKIYLLHAMDYLNNNYLYEII
jgi:hypothetical protein